MSTLKNYERFITAEQKETLENNLKGDARECEIKEEIKKLMAIFYNSPNDYRAGQFAELIGKTSFTLKAIRKGVAHAKENATSMPSVAVLKEFIRQFDWQETDKKEESRKELEMEDRRFEQIKNEFINIYGQEKLDGFVKWWLIKEYGESGAAFLAGNEKLFLKSALFDLKKAGMNFKGLDFD